MPSQSSLVLDRTVVAFDTVVLSSLLREPGSQLTTTRLNYLRGQKPRNDTQRGCALVREACIVEGCAHYGWLSAVHAPSTSGGSGAEHDLFFDSLMTTLFEVFTTRYTQQHLDSTSTRYYTTDRGGYPQDKLWIPAEVAGRSQTDQLTDILRRLDIGRYGQPLKY